MCAKAFKQCELRLDRHSGEPLSMDCEEGEVEPSDSASQVSEQRSVMSNSSAVMRRIELECKKAELRNFEEYRMFQKEWTDFELLSWSFYMQVFAKTTFLCEEYSMIFYAQLLQPINFSQNKKRYFKHIARNSHFLCLPLDDWDTLLFPSMLGMAYWVPTGLKKPVLACLHDQNKSGFFGGPAFFQPITAFWKLLRLLWLAG